MERERALVAPAGIITLGIGQLTVPATEINFGEPLDIAAPLAGAQRVAVSPQCACEVWVGLCNDQLAFLTGFGFSPLADATRVARFFNNADLRLNPGQWPGLGVGFQRLEVTLRAREHDAAVLGGPVRVDVVRANILHRKLLYCR